MPRPPSSPPQERPIRPRRGGLGRGLESLIPSAPAAATANPASITTEGPYRDIPIDQIDPNPYQPRTRIEPDALDDLAASIRQHGLMQALLVTPGTSEDRWTLIAGERRWRASRIAGLTTVPAIVKASAPQAMLELAIVENLLRADLGPVEEALAFNQLVEEFGLTQQQVADRVGRSRAAVANTMRLLGAPERIRQELANGTITEGHARALLGLQHSTDQLAVLDVVIERGLNVRQTESIVREWAAKPARRVSAVPVRDPNEEHIENRLRDTLGTKVALKRRVGDGAGSLTIQFHSDEQLQAIYDRIVGEDIW